MARTILHPPAPLTPKEQPRRGPNLKFRQVEDPGQRTPRRAGRVVRVDQLGRIFRIIRRASQLRRMLARRLEMNERLIRENTESLQRLRESRVKLGLIRRKYFLECQSSYYNSHPHWFYIKQTLLLLYLLLFFSLAKLGLITDYKAGPEIVARLLSGTLAFIYILFVAWDLFIWPILPEEDLYILRNLADFAMGFGFFSVTKGVVQGFGYLLFVVWG